MSSSSLLSVSNMDTDESKISTLNILNAVGFVLNVGFAGATPAIFDLPDNAVLSKKYQTLVTPSGGTFSIWGIIFMTELLFIIAQFLPQYRNSKIVKDAIGWWYFAACLFQGPGWSIAFAAEHMNVAFVLMLCILGCLIKIVFNLSKMKRPSQINNREYWLLEFTHSLHCGWIIDAAFVNLSVLMIEIGTDDANANGGSEYATNQSDQLAVAILSFAAITGVVLFNLLPSSHSLNHNRKSITSNVFRLDYLFSSSPTNLTIVYVQAWALNGIRKQLEEPKDVILEKFPSMVISAGLSTAGFLSTLTFVLLFVMIAKELVSLFFYPSIDAVDSERRTEDEDVKKSISDNAVHVNMS